MDMDDLFVATAPQSRTDFIADPVIIVKNEIRDDFIVPNAVDTPDPAPIAPLWARCSFTISAGHQNPDRRLALATLREAVQHAVACNLIHELKITHCRHSSIALSAWIKLPKCNGELTLRIRQPVLVQRQSQQLLQLLLHLLRHLVQHPQHPLTLRQQLQMQRLRLSDLHLHLLLQ